MFFRYVPEFMAWQFRYPLPKGIGPWIGLVGVAVAWVSGYRAWKAGGGLYSYHESSLYHNLGSDSAGGYYTSLYTHRVTAPAYILSQIFMAGPLWILRAWTLFHSRIPYSVHLESSLERTLAVLRAVNKWQGLNECPAARTEILYLAQMGHLDFSTFKGTPRFKAR
jgi:hypothetical protein